VFSAEAAAGKVLGEAAAGAGEAAAKNPEEVAVAGAKVAEEVAAVASAARIPATRALADEIASVGLPRSKQTVLLLETREGPTIVAAGGPDLTPAQKALAGQKGLLLADDMPGFHAEITGVVTAGDRGLLPTRGVVTNKMCIDGPDSCFRTTLQDRRGGGL
jgi:hypothetical protein